MLFTEYFGRISCKNFVKESDGSIRMCVDMTEPNKAIRRVRHVVSTIEDMRYQVNGAKKCSKVDHKNGYHQLKLAESSRNLTTFFTHVGLARCCRLNFGTNSAAESFHYENEYKTLKELLVPMTTFSCMEKLS